MAPRAGTLFIVATPIGNLEDITARALRILGEVDVIAAEDTRRTAHLLTRYAITTPMTSLHEHNEHVKSRSLVERLLEGQSVALVSDAGMPTVSDPGQKLVKLAISAAIRIEAIPGPSAVIAALASSGFATDSFTFLGFPPARGRERKAWMERLGQIRGTVVLFEAPHRLRKTLQEIALIEATCDVVVCRELTKAHEELVRGPIEGVLGNLRNPRGEYTIVIDIGLKTNIRPREDVAGDLLWVKLSELTESGAVSRREAIRKLARDHRLTPKQVYTAIELHRKSVV